MVRTDKKGFTLIELMIVVAIIGILAAVAIPAYSGYTKKAKLTEVTNAMGAVATAATEYYQSLDTWPSMNTIAMIRTSLGVTIPETYVDGCVIAPVAAGDPTQGATIEVTFSSTAPDSTWENRTLTLAINQGTKGSWTGTIPTSYVPK